MTASVCQAFRMYLVRDSSVLAYSFNRWEIMGRAGHGSKRPREMKLLSPTSCSAQYLVVHRGSDQVPGEVQFTPLHLALCFLKLNKKKN